MNFKKLLLFGLLIVSGITKTDSEKNLNSSWFNKTNCFAFAGTVGVIMMGRPDLIMYVILLPVIFSSNK